MSNATPNAISSRQVLLIAHSSLKLAHVLTEQSDLKQMR